MKSLKLSNLLVIVLFAAAVLPACKAKKAVVAPPPAEVVTQTPAPASKSTPAAPVQEAPAPPPAKPNFNFKNIQFEFNSAVLKTDSYQLLDVIVAEIKKAPDTKFILNGNSSSEGTPEHNMTLSVDRANAVKLYLQNSGINGDNLTTKGYGESKPVADNTTEAGKALNRRVEVKLAQ